MTTATVKLPPKLVPVFAAVRGALRFRGAKGGRGSAKSFTFAKMAAIWGLVEPLRILCTREYMNSIKESFHAEIKNAIASEPWLASAYDVGVDFVRGFNGTEFIFKGLRNNISSIKSMAQIDLCIVEEAEDVSEAAWRDLLPTIRAPKSEFWLIWNPKKDGSPTDTRFVKNIPPRSMIVEMNYQDNPWFPMELEELRQQQKETLDDATYSHIWEGKYLKMGAAQVFRNKYRTDAFMTQWDWDGPYYGLDFGFSQDPTFGVCCWIYDEKLYIEHEGGKVGLELDDTSDFLIENIPGIEKHTVRADCARPESISYLQRHGIPDCVGVDKWPGSVEDGVEFIKSFREVVIHPRCAEILNEFRNYSYKVDRLSGDILPIIVDDYNHGVDALRYALAPIIKGAFTDYGSIL